MTNKMKNRQFREMAGFSLDMMKECKLKIICIAVALIIALLTGVIVAARTHSSFVGIENYGIVDVRTGTLTTTFFSRLLSMFFVTLIVFGCSYAIYLCPLAIAILVYRAYLLGLNICLMIVFYGLSGVIVAIVVALPCQLLVLAIIGLFYCLMSKTFKEYKCFGGCRVPKQKSKLILCTLVMLLLLCVLETILVALFSAKVILVI